MILLVRWQFWSEATHWWISVLQTHPPVQPVRRTFYCVLALLGNISSTIHIELNVSENNDREPQEVGPTSTKKLAESLAPEVKFSKAGER
jgi:hypothetical protein